MEKYIQQSSSLFGSLKTAVLGNAVTREFSIERQIGSFGPGLSWKIFEGKKKSTGQDVSVFVFEKKQLERFGKAEREHAIDRMKRGPVQLTKLRHPRLLTVQHPLEESRDCLAFATEPVFASLANALGRLDNIPTPVPNELQNYQMYDVEKNYGLFQISEGLAFLHNDVKLVEGNVTPESIVLTREGHWKLSGFFFSTSAVDSAAQEPWNSQIPLLLKPDLNYVAPEYVLENRMAPASDMHSFGCVLCAVYANMKTPFDAGNNVTSYKRCVEQLSRLGSDRLNLVPIGIRDHLMLQLNLAMGVRPDADTTSKHQYFNDAASMTLKYLDSLVQRDNITKSNFFKSLHRVLRKLPKRVLHQRVLPQMFLEFPNHAMIPFVLPNVFLIAEDCSAEEFGSLILPELKKIFTVQEPVQVLLIFMQKMELLLKLTPPDDVRSFVLPMIFRALESQATQIQELVLSLIPNFAHLVDYSTMKNSILPRIRTLMTRTNSLTVRVNSLVCIGKIIDQLDKFLMIDHVFPALTQVPSREPAVLMAILGIYKKTVSHKKIHLEMDYLARKVVPFLLPLAVEPGLNATQFNNFMAVIREIMDTIEQEHRTKLEQLDKMKEQQRSALDFAKDVESAKENEEVMKQVDELIIGSNEGHHSLSRQSMNIGSLRTAPPVGSSVHSSAYSHSEEANNLPWSGSSSSSNAATNSRASAGTGTTGWPSSSNYDNRVDHLPSNRPTGFSTGQEQILQPVASSANNRPMPAMTQTHSTALSQGSSQPFARAPMNPSSQWPAASTGSSSLDLLLTSDMGRHPQSRSNMPMGAMPSTQPGGNAGNSSNYFGGQTYHQPQFGTGGNSMPQGIMQPHNQLGNNSLDSLQTAGQFSLQSGARHPPAQQQPSPGLLQPLIPAQPTSIVTGQGFYSDSIDSNNLLL